MNNIILFRLTCAQVKFSSLEMHVSALLGLIGNKYIAQNKPIHTTKSLAMPQRILVYFVLCKPKTQTGRVDGSQKGLQGVEF